MKLFAADTKRRFWRDKGATSKATMCFVINRYANYVPIPKKMLCTPYQGFGEPMITGPGWNHVKDNVWKQQDGAIPADDRPRSWRGPAGYEQSHDVLWNQQILKLRSSPQDRVNPARPSSGGQF